MRRAIRWMHTWLGLVGGAFICLMGFTGGLVGLRPQIATLLSPPAQGGNCIASPDWNRAAGEIAAYSGSEINRVYGPYGADTRYHFRMATSNPILFRHVIYDACAGRILGSINMGWMDWIVDLHHNLLAGKTGRLWAGAIGVAMLLSGLGGLLLWLLTRPSLRTAFRVRLRLSRATPREMHRAAGLFAVCLLMLEAFTGLWLTFPQAMRGTLAVFGPVEENVRPVRAKRVKGAEAKAGLGDLMAAARAALPDGQVREIRLSPEGAQFRMWLPGDFRSLGNNVVFVSAAGAKVLAVDRYADRAASNRIVQAMAGLHYDEWGGLPLRILCCAAGLLTPVLFVSGILLWWYARRRRTKPYLPALSSSDFASAAPISRT